MDPCVPFCPTVPLHSTASLTTSISSWASFPLVSKPVCMNIPPAGQVALPGGMVWFYALRGGVGAGDTRLPLGSGETP